MCWKGVAKGKLYFRRNSLKLEIELLDKDNEQKSLAAVSSTSGFCTCPPFLSFLFLEEEKSMGRDHSCTAWTSILDTEILRYSL